VGCSPAQRACVTASGGVMSSSALVPPRMLPSAAADSADSVSASTSAGEREKRIGVGPAAPEACGGVAADRGWLPPLSPALFPPMPCLLDAAE
jgi:hypothetical protein